VGSLELMLIFFRQVVAKEEWWLAKAAVLNGFRFNQMFIGLLKLTCFSQVLKEARH